MYNQDTYKGASFSLTNRLKRLLWGFVYTLFFKYSPKPLHVWRSWLLRLFGAEIGKGTHIYPKVSIWAPWNLKIGIVVGIADGVILYSQDKITIGDRATISQGSHICTGTHDYTKMEHPLITLPITIGANAWIAAECFIYPGVTIGEGCIIGARSVVTKDMPVWTVCVGHPCVPKKVRLMTN